MLSLEEGEMNKWLRLLAVPLVCGLVLAACSDSTTSGQGTGTPSESPSANACASPPVKQAGTLTVAAEFPYYAPFLIGAQADPTGFEAEVIHGIATRLNLPSVTWVNIAFDQLYAPGPKQWDLGVSEITITDERDQAIDFSAPYFDANQGILVKADSKYASATTTQDLLDAKFGAEQGTTGLAYVQEHVKPTKAVSQFDTTDITAQALKSGTIDVQIIDVPIAVGIIQGSQVPLKLLGEFITNEKYGLAMEEGNPLKQCVDQAINDLQSTGELEKAQVKFFPGSTPLTEFKPTV
jgi:polar amino acid transport system substrate-binding protein